MVGRPQAQFRLEAIINISDGHTCQGCLQLSEVIVLTDINDFNLAAGHIFS
jgi:hypothetical protein